MLYPSLPAALEAHAAGQNIAARLRAELGVSQNSAEIIEIAYDLQAGSYIDMVARRTEDWQAYVDELATHLAAHVRPDDRVLDAGAGEMTTLAGVAEAGCGVASEVFACDISWSRLNVGRPFVASTAGDHWSERVVPFVADMTALPLADQSIDLVWTAHAVEPNRGREQEVLTELLRVTRRRLILFEPSYEHNTEAGRARMREHGYVRGLPEAIATAGGTLESLVPVESVLNPLNPTFVHVIRPPEQAGHEESRDLWRCPTTGAALERHVDCLWSPGAKLAYPVLAGIPVLRREAAILASTPPWP